MDRERLTILADFLDTVPGEKFDLFYWFTEKGTHTCRTVACACGWATTIPEFASDGFVLSISNTPFYKSECDWDGVELFFNINYVIAKYLFSINSYTQSNGGPKDVATRIRSLLKGV